MDHKSLLSLPAYSDIFPTPESTVMDIAALFNPQGGPNYDGTYSVHEWLTRVLTAIQNTSPAVHIITNFRHYKSLSLAEYQHEFLLLRIHPHTATAPTSDATPAYFLKVFRTITNARGTKPKLGTHGDAHDRVEVVPNGNPAPGDELINELSWTNEHAPRLFNMSRIFVYIQDIHPKYKVVSTQCYFFAYTAYEVMKTSYAPFTERPGRKHGKGARFLFVFSAGKAAAEKTARMIVRLERSLMPMCRQGQDPAPADPEGSASVPVAGPSRTRPDSEGVGSDVRIDIAGRVSGKDLVASMRGRRTTFENMPAAGQVSGGTGMGHDSEDILTVEVRFGDSNFEASIREGMGAIHME